MPTRHATAASNGLTARVGHALERVAAELGGAAPDELGADDVGALVELAVELVVQRLEEASARAGDDLAQLGRMMLELHDILLEVHANARNQRVEALANVHDGLARLRRVSDVATLIAEAPAEVCRSCGFERAILFRTEHGALTVESLYVEGDPRDTDELRRRLAQAPFALRPGSVEAEIVRRQVASLVVDPLELESCVAVELRRAHAFVATPIISEGHVIGVLEADASLSGRPLSQLDSDALRAFGSGLGQAVERAVLLERLRAQRDEMRRLVNATEKTVADLCDAQIRLASVDDATGGLIPAGRSLLVSREHDLSDREVAVIEAIAAGASNAEIAERLFITEDTVKSHVKRILRKLGAVNRAQAVARFVREDGER